jgi:adenosylcobinamide kinase/adenosylcobinamide-phosphate guanylyltransferase
MSAERILCGTRALSGRCENIIVVTNDVGSDEICNKHGTMEYIHALGWLNAKMAAEFDEVYEMVVGIPIRLK